MTSTNCLDTALELLNCYHLWPVVIYPAGVKLEDRVTTGKEPIGLAWGKTRPTEQSIRAMFRSNPGAGVGLRLGPESGIFDIECDGPEGEDSYIKLMGGEIIATLGWSSRRGPHHVFRYDTRLEAYGKSILKLPELPGLEIRIGEKGKQLQSVCPPTVGQDGKPREWNDCPIIADPPEAMFLFLETVLDAALERAAIQADEAPEREAVRHAGTLHGPLPVEERCRLYLAKVEAGVEGQNGSTPMMRAAGVICRFGILDEPGGWRVGFQLLSEYGAKCSPPWRNEKQIEHKLSDAFKKEKRRDLRDKWAERGNSFQAIGPSPSNNGSSGEVKPVGATVFDPASIKWTGKPRSVRQDLLSVPPLPQDLVPEPLRPWLSDIAERVSCPLDFAVVPALVALGTVLGRKIGMRPKAHDVWTVIPNPWGAIIGRPGVLKSPPLKEALLPLRRLEVEAREIFEREQATYESRLVVKDIEQKMAKQAIQEAIKAKKSKDHIEKLAANLRDIIPPDAPVQRRYTTSDATMEALGPLLAQHGHIGILRDELTGWFRSLERSDQGTAKAFFLELYDGLGDLYQFDRIGRGHLSIKGGTGQVLGGIQPGPWRSLLRAILQDAAADDGLISRLSLLVWPDVAEWRHVDRWPDTKAKNAAFEIYQRLANLAPDQIGAKIDEYGSGMPYLHFDHEAQELFNVWHTNLEIRLRTNDESPLLESHLAKYRKLMPQMAFISHVVQAVTDGLAGPVASEHAVRGMHWCEYLEKHARRAYAIGSDQDIEPALALMEKIKAGALPSPFTSREVYRHHWSNLDDPRLVGCAIAVLEDHNWLNIVETKQERGAPKEDVHIHPSLPRKASENENGPAGGCQK